MAGQTPSGNQADRVCSYYPSLTENLHLETVSIRQALEGIKTGRWRVEVEALRRSKEKDIEPESSEPESSELKKELPLHTFGGTFAPSRSRANLLVASQLIIIDINHCKSILAEIKQSLAAMPACWGAWISPSGDGLKALIEVREPLSPENNPQAFLFVAECVRDATGLRYAVNTEDSGIDMSMLGQDIARACFVSYDVDAYIADPATIQPMGWLMNEDPPETSTPAPSIPETATTTGNLVQDAMNAQAAAEAERRLVAGDDGDGDEDEDRAESRLTICQHLVTAEIPSHYLLSGISGMDGLVYQPTEGRWTERQWAVFRKEIVNHVNLNSLSIGDHVGELFNDDTADVIWRHGKREALLASSTFDSVLMDHYRYRRDGRTPEDFPEPVPDYINTAAGALFLPDGTIHPHAPGLYCRSVTAAKYLCEDSASIDAELWAHLEPTFSREAYDRFIDVGALAMTGRSHEFWGGAICMITGSSGSGKSHAVGIMTGQAGSYADRVPRKFFAATNNATSEIDVLTAELMRRDRRIVSCDEFGKGARLNEGKLLMVSGGDGAHDTSRVPYGGAMVRGRYRMTWVLSMTTTPRFSRTGGMERRLTVIATRGQNLASLNNMDTSAATVQRMRDIYFTLAVRRSALVYLPGFDGIRGDETAKQEVLEDADPIASYIAKWDPHAVAGDKEAISVVVAAYRKDVDSKMEMPDFHAALRDSPDWEKKQLTIYDIRQPCMRRKSSQTTVAILPAFEEVLRQSEAAFVCEICNSNNCFHALRALHADQPS